MALTVWLVLAAAWVIFIIPVLMLRRRVDRHAWPAWTTMLQGDVGAHFAYLRDLFEGNAELARDMAMLAKRHRARGAEAARARLTGALDLLETLSRSMRGRLDEWLVVCRAALALYPLPPLADAAYRLRALRTLARLHAVAHLAPVTSGERFRLRLRVLDWGFRLVGTSARRAKSRLPTDGAVPPTAWRQASSLAHDFGALSSEALTTARGLLAVVAARAAPTGDGE